MGNVTAFDFDSRQERQDTKSAKKRNFAFSIFLVLLASWLSWRRYFIACIGVILLGGCTIHPPGEREERSAAQAAGKRFERPIEKREPLILPANPTADDLVRYAMISNADLESRYWQWRAAIEQIPQDATQATNLNLAFGSAITNGKTSRGQSTITVGNDPMSDIKWPGKLDAAGKIAMENARAAGLRFRGAQFELRNKVLSAYYDFVLNTELIRLTQANQQLLETTATVSENRNAGGLTEREDVLKARTEVDLSKNDLANMEAQIPALQAAINALLDRAPNAPLSMSNELPYLAKLKYDEDQMLAMVAARNPEVAAIASETQGRQEGVRLAKLQYIPDFNLSAGTDLAGITQNILGQATVPLLRYEALNAAIDQAQANLRSSQAMHRQTVNDLYAQVIMDVSTIRDSQRQIELFQTTILPRAQQLVDVARANYESGRATLLDLLDSQRTLISVQRVIVNLRVLRGKRQAELEAIAGMPLGSDN